MLLLDQANSSRPLSRSHRTVKYAIIVLSVLLGCASISAFVFVAIHWNLHAKTVDQCRNDRQSMVLCYLRLLFTNALQTHWDKYIMVTFLLTYASVFYHIITESSRTNVSGLLGQMIIQTIAVIIGIGVSFPLLFLLSYIYFYRSTRNANKSSVPIDVLAVAITYVVAMIILPTYLIYFLLASHPVVVSIMSIVLLVSPLGFALTSFPFRLLSPTIQRYWIISSHRLIVRSQLGLFILSAPLYFIALVSLIYHWSFDEIQHSYVSTLSVANPIMMIWTIDYASLFISLIFFITTDEYLATPGLDRTQGSSIKTILSWMAFAVLFAIAPCLAFPLYIAWKEYQYIQVS